MACLYHMGEFPRKLRTKAWVSVLVIYLSSYARTLSYVLFEIGKRLIAYQLPRKIKRVLICKKNHFGRGEIGKTLDMIPIYKHIFKKYNHIHFWNKSIVQIGLQREN